MLFGLVLALVGGGGGFFAVYSGMILGASDEAHAPAEDVVTEALPDVSFVPLEQIVISLGPGARSNHLRFRAQLEVPGEYQSDVEQLVPRVIDVLNSYLRALEPADLEEPSALIRLRAQMLRRVQMVVGQGRVRDLLVMEFVLN